MSPSRFVCIEIHSSRGRTFTHARKLAHIHVVTRTLTHTHTHARIYTHKHSHATTKRTHTRTHMITRADQPTRDSVNVNNGNRSEQDLRLWLRQTGIPLIPARSVQEKTVNVHSLSGVGKREDRWWRRRRSRRRRMGRKRAEIVT